MRGKRSKTLKKLADQFVLSGGHSLGEGATEYNQAMNCRAWVPAYEMDGSRKRAPDGTPLLKPIMNPGTLTTKWIWRNVYQQLKKRWKADQQDILFTGIPAV